MVPAPLRSGANTTAAAATKCLHERMLVVPDELIAAAHHLDVVQSELSSANLRAAASTTSIATAAHDEISVNIANLFSTYAHEFHAAVEQTGIFGTQQFGQGLTSAASAYSSAEAANVASFADELQALANQIGAALELAYFFVVIFPVILPVLIVGGVLFLLVYAYIIAIAPGYA